MKVSLNHFVKILCRSTLVLSVLLLGSSAWASNGLQVIGSGPISLSMGGAGVANPQSSNAIYLNPAGMTALGYQTDLAFTVAFPNTRMGSSLAPAGNTGAVNVGDTAQAAFFPSGSIVFKAFGSDRISLGVGAIPSAGFQVDFPVSRFSSAITGNTYDRSGRYGNIKIIPAVGVKINDKLSVGAGLDINYAFFHSDSATLAPGFPETMGTSRFDSALGIGGRVGLIYAPIDMLQMGVTYVFRSRFKKFGRYSDLISTGLDLPQQVAFGLSLKPFEGALLLTDFRWIDWSSGFFGRSLAAGGLQWRDQYVFAGGMAYDFAPKFSFPLTVRMGYNYGRSPITPATAFRNLLIPTVIEHHLTTGISLDLSEHIGMDLAYIKEFGNTVTDNGSGNPTGAGAFTKTSVHAFSVGVRGTWGKDKPPE